ncbi:hypothetical protein BH23GEM11_BH23GEM11_06530 [soil metagenome]
MKRTNLWALALAPFVFAACGPGTVQVNSEADFRDPETQEQVTRPLTSMEIQLIPFDRDALFDSLTAAAPRPEPGFPEELELVQDSLFAAQEAQREAESEWLALRERLGVISREMEDYSPAEGRYQVLFTEFNTLEGRVTSAERRQDEAFLQVEEIRSRVLGDLAVARQQQEQWEDEAFADYPEILEARLRESRRTIMYDTTDAMGQATFRAPTGEWWIHARYALPTQELYWNIRVDVDRGDPLQVRLSRENAEPRRAF